MKNLIASTFTGILLLAACADRPFSSGDQPASQTSRATTMIPIGVALAQTSNLALLGQESVNGAKLAEQYFNAQGGIRGIPIKLIFQDAGGDEAGAINAFQTLITRDKVVGIVGPSSSQQAFSADPIADRAQVPVVGPTNTAKGVPEIGEFVARVASPVTLLAPNSLKAALKLKPDIRRVAVFYAQNDAFSQSETTIFQQAIQDQGLEIITIQKFQTTDADFQTQATAAINLKPDLMVISGLAADSGNLVRQIRELGYQGLIIGGNGFNTPNIFPLCKQLCDGVLVAQAYSPEHDNAINRSFREAYIKQYQKDPPQFSAQGFTAVQVIVDALTVIDQQKPIRQLPLPELRTALNQQILAGNYETPLGKISFTPVGEVVQEKFYVAQIQMNPDGKNGKFVFLK
ncbi:ABC transporter substrate-binding protein [Pantanalinema sp. GBBB05]|uniref:ABC transporter substrate-binding protein n=1 Tax=Pantanalinema sp. GBBB05 TaxID=2604139 RepID=UPI001DA424DF|nr:ABC transporter substrate-binding protein [Pantanalinema sp. GBBB05]